MTAAAFPEFPPSHTLQHPTYPIGELGHALPGKTSSTSGICPAARRPPVWWCYDAGGVGVATLAPVLTSGRLQPEGQVGTKRLATT